VTLHRRSESAQSSSAQLPPDRTSGSGSNGRRLLPQLPLLPEQNDRDDDFQETRNPTPFGERQYGVRRQYESQHRDTEVCHP
jgi:hypothetical protein